MRTPVSVTPSRIRYAAAAATVLSTNNTRVRLCGIPVRASPHEICHFSLRTVRLSQSETALLRVGTKGQAPKDHRNRPDAVPQTCLETVQERFQVRCNLSTRNFVNAECGRHRSQGEYGGEEARSTRLGMNGPCRLCTSLSRSTFCLVEV
jgi:hypothetical protein